MTPRLRIDLFDGVRASVGGVALDIPSAKARAMLACLVLGGSGAESREVLSERLWSRSPSAEHQRNSLKRDLKNLVDLFRAQGFDGLYGRRQTVHLDLARTDSDVLEALRSAERGLAHRALLDGDRPFERLALGCDDVDPTFSAWLSTRARGLAETTERALDRALGREDIEPYQRIDLARATFNLDRTKQPAAMVLMETLAAAGDLSGALKVYRTLYFAHLQDYGDPPSGEILTLVERLKPGGERQDTDGGGGGGGKERRRPGRPAPVRIEIGEAQADPVLRRIAFAVIDALGRRPGLVSLTGTDEAGCALRIAGDGDGGAFLQLWRMDPERLAWSEHLSRPDPDAVEAAARRLGAAAADDAAAAPRLGNPQPGPVSRPETFALRLLLSRPEDPAHMPAEDPSPVRFDAVAAADRGWIALMQGQRRDAVAALREAAALDPDALEPVGAAALGLAILGLADEAVRLADRLAMRPADPGLRALRGTTLAVCGDRRLASACLADLPESWLLPRCLGAAMAELAGDRSAALACIGPSLARLAGDSDSFCDWALRALPLPEAAEPLLLRQTLATLVADRCRMPPAAE